MKPIMLLGITLWATSGVVRVEGQSLTDPTSLSGKVLSVVHGSEGWSFAGQVLLRDQDNRYWTIRIPAEGYGEGRTLHLVTMFSAPHESMELMDIGRWNGSRAVVPSTIVTLYNPSAVKTTSDQRVVAVTLAQQHYDGFTGWVLARNGRTRRYNIAYIPRTHKVGYVYRQRSWNEVLRVMGEIQLHRSETLFAQKMLTAFCSLNQFVEFAASPSGEWIRLSDRTRIVVQLRDVPLE